MKKITYVCCLHGDEVMPALALTSVGVPFIMGNPEAVRKGARYVESDINAAFGKKSVDLETRRAKKVLAQIPKKALIVDFHSHSTDSGPFVIIVDPKMLPLALQTGLKRVVYMNFNIKKGHALINYRSGVSVEVGEHSDPTGFEVALQVAKNLAQRKPKTSPNVELYEVFGQLKKHKGYKNFVKHKDGFYPIFAGSSGRGQYALKAKRVTSFS